MRTVLQPITVTIDGRATPSETTLAHTAPHIVALTTALPDIPLTVISTFIGAPDVDTTIVDLELGMRPDATTQSRVVPRDEVPVTHAYDRCLLEHAAVVQAALAKATSVLATVDISKIALANARA